VETIVRLDGIDVGVDTGEGLSDKQYAGRQVKNELNEIYV